MAVKFKRVSAAFDEEARARLWGSEHYAAQDDSPELSDLVVSFLERDVNELVGDEEWKVDEEGREFERENYWSDSVMKKRLQDLIGGDDGGDKYEDDVKRKIRGALEVECRSLESSPAEEFKWRLMSLLRGGGFDAGLCKSRWEKNSRNPGGEYQYIDVLVAGSRYVVEVFLVGEFTIARPTSCYQSLLQAFPRVTVVNQYELKQVVRLMCAAMKKSMNLRDMHVPPWRRNGYMQAKWFGPYKRTTNTVPASSAPDSVKKLAGKRLAALPAVQYCCGGEVVRKVSSRSGMMGEVWNGMEL